MRKIIVGAFIFAALCLPAAAQDATAIWSQLQQPVLDPAKSAVAENVSIVRDRIQIRLVNGTIQLAQPLNGRVYGAGFRGKGMVMVDPPNERETQQLKINTRTEKLALEFDQAADKLSINENEDTLATVK